MSPISQYKLRRFHAWYGRLLDRIYVRGALAGGALTVVGVAVMLFISQATGSIMLSIGLVALIFVMFSATGLGLVIDGYYRFRLRSQRRPVLAWVILGFMLAGAFVFMCMAIGGVVALIRR